MELIPVRLPRNRWATEPFLGQLVIVFDDDDVPGMYTGAPGYSPIMPVLITVAERDAPTAIMLADRGATYQLATAPYTRYQSNGVGLLQLGGVGGGGGDLLAANNLSDVSNASAARGNLGVAIGVNVQAFSPTLDDLATVTPTAFGKSLLSSAGAAAARTLLVLGSAALADTTAFELSGAVAAHSALASGVHGISTFGASLVDDANAAAARATLGLGSAAVAATTDFEATGSVAGHATVTSGVHGISNFGATLVDDANAAAARATLGVSIGSQVQAYSVNLDAYATTAPSAFGLSLLDDTDAASARATLGLAIGSNIQAWSANLDEYATVNPSAFALTILDDTDAASARATLGLVIGTNVQAFAASASQAEAEAATEANLRAFSPLRVGQAITALATLRANNLSDLANAGTARTNLGMSANGSSLVTAANYAAMRALLDLEAGTDFNAYSAGLAQIAALADPNADRLLFWDDSAGAYTYLTLGTNLSITGTTLNATGGGGGDVSTDAIWDAAGDLVVGTGANTAARLAKGANYSYLWVDEGGTVEWRAPQIYTWETRPTPSAANLGEEFYITTADSGNIPIYQWFTVVTYDGGVNYYLRPNSGAVEWSINTDSASHTGTLVDTTIATDKIPAGLAAQAIGGRLTAVSEWDYGGAGATTWRVRMKIGGVDWFDNTSGSAIGRSARTGAMMNIDAASGAGSGSSPGDTVTTTGFFNGSTAAWTSWTIDWTADVSIAHTMELGNTANSAVLRKRTYRIEYPARMN